MILGPLWTWKAASQWAQRPPPQLGQASAEDGSSCARHWAGPPSGGAALGRPPEIRNIWPSWAGIAASPRPPSGSSPTELDRALGRGPGGRGLLGTACPLCFRKRTGHGSQPLHRPAQLACFLRLEAHDFAPSLVGRRWTFGAEGPSCPQGGTSCSRSPASRQPGSPGPQEPGKDRQPQATGSPALPEPWSATQPHPSQELGAGSIPCQSTQPLALPPEL